MTCNKTDSTPDETDEKELRAAVAQGNVPILLLVLVQLTGDLRWLEPPYLPSRTIGMDDNDSGGLPPELQQEVRAAAADAIISWRKDGKTALERPDDELLTRMLSVCLGEPVPGVSGRRMAAMLQAAIRPEETAYPPVETPPGFKVVVIGAGFSGLCMAARLTQARIPVLVLDKADDIGGVWFSNRYPGAGVDTPSYLYSLSFVPYEWRHYYAGRDEVHAYLRHIVDRFELSPHIQLRREVTRAAFDEESQTWALDVRDENGEIRQVRANVVVSAVGIFNPPVIPDLNGLATFAGPAFHTAEWRDVDLHGKRVAVVGNGASAMQTVPAIAAAVASLTVFQRSPHWIAPFPKFKAPIPEPTALLLREVPLYRAWFRERIGWIFGDRNYRSLHKDPEWPWPERALNAQNDSHRRFFERYLKTKLTGRPDLIDKCLPAFPPFAKRMLLDNGWFDALRRDNVTLESDAITEVVPGGVVTSTGTRYDLDVLIFATGFGVARFISTLEVVGRDGRTLREAWNDDDARAYLGMTVPGFPNFFMMYGPNVNGGGGSVLGHLEAEVHYILELLRQLMAAGAASADVKADAYESHASKVAARHENLIYTHPGVNTYYRNARGRVVTQNPFTNAEFWQLTRCPRLADYTLGFPGPRQRAKTGMRA
jgi:4-hydroxyacetophenone monooxygenase